VLNFVDLAVVGPRRSVAVNKGKPGSPHEQLRFSPVRFFTSSLLLSSSTLAFVCTYRLIAALLVEEHLSFVPPLALRRPEKDL